MNEQNQYRATFGEDFTTFIKSRSPIAYIETTELSELRENILNVQKDRKIQRSIFYYSAGGTLSCLRWQLNHSYKLSDAIQDNFNSQSANRECTVEDFVRRITTEPSQSDPSRTSIPSSCILIASGITDLLNDTNLGQQLVEAVANGYFTQNRVALVLADVVGEMPTKLLKYAQPIVFGLPDEQELTRKFQQIRDEVIATVFSKKKGVDLSYFWFSKENMWKEVVKATCGMTTFEAALCYRICFGNTTGINITLPELLSYIYKQKQNLIYNSTALQFIPESELPDINQIGGLDFPKYFLSIRAAAFNNPDSGLDLPKGIVLKGPSGCGKSMFAKATGKLLNLPVIALEFGSVFNAYTGVSENRIRQELERVDAFNGSVLLIDEADKAFAGSVSDSGSDNGVAMRVFGIILKWLQERKSRTFVVLTINNDKDLPPELLRCGRFDKVFTVALPNESERKAILASHLHRRNIDLQLSYNESEKLLVATKGFSGAQLEAVVIESQYLAFSKRKDKNPTAQDILEAVAIVKA